MLRIKTITATTVIASVLFLCSISAVVYDIHVRTQQQHTACVQVENLKGAIRTVFNRSLKTLPTSPYYTAHPDELKAAQAHNREFVKLFEKKDC